jgi:hypothetical protein
MKFEVKGIIHCDNCGLRVGCVFFFKLGGDSRSTALPLSLDYPQPEQGKAFNGRAGAEYLCDNCYAERE